jgi:hypothetical protein
MSESPIVVPTSPTLGQALTTSSEGWQYSSGDNSGAVSVWELQGNLASSSAPGTPWRWILSTITSSTNALDGHEYICNTVAGPITLTLVSTNSGAIVKVTDYFKTNVTSITQGFAANHVTVTAPSGYTIYGTTSLILDRSSISPEFKLYGSDWAITGGIIR